MRLFRIAGMALMLCFAPDLARSQTTTIAGQQVSGSTSCADALRMQKQAGPAGNAALKQRISVLMKTYAPMGIDGKGGQMSPGTMDLAIAYGTRWCQRHPDRTLADAAKAARKSQNRLLSILMNAPAPDTH